MSIWIRSKSGQVLLEAHKLDIKLDYMNNNPTCFIRADGNVIGGYPTEAEAQAVLDQIQGHINRCAKTVYQMPEAGFSKEGR